MILLGLDENRAFEVIGVGDAHQIMEEVSGLAAENMEPALRPEFTLVEIQGKSVLAIEIFEVAPEQKPCFYKTAGLQSGSYILMVGMQFPPGLLGDNGSGQGIGPSSKWRLWIMPPERCNSPLAGGV